MASLYCSQGHENQPGSRFCNRCGERLSTPVGVVGAVLGDRYRVMRELGHGGFGRTYLAEDINRFREPCVLKEFAPQVEGTAALQKAEELFEREAGVLYQLNHPQIPRFREMFRATLQDRGALFLVQDYVEGQTYHALLEERRRQGSKFSEPEVIRLLQQMLPVLAYIHSTGVIHRDISPDNVIQRQVDGLPVLIDFGGVKQVAAAVASQLNQGGSAPTLTRLGKVGYAPEEQMQTGIVFPHSDLYALGVTALVLLTGKEPQDLLDRYTLSWRWKQEVTPSPGFTAILDRMLAQMPRDRFQSAYEVMQALQGSPVPVYPAIEPAYPVPPTVQMAPPAPISYSVSPGATATVSPAPVVSARQGGGWGWLFAGFLLLGSMALVGWWGTQRWLDANQRETPRPSPTPSIAVSPSPDPLSPEEQARKGKLRDRQAALGIDDRFFVPLVNEFFFDRFPDQRKRSLTSDPRDAELRQQWDEMALDLLNRLEPLSQGARKRLGSYTPADIEQRKAQVNQLRLSSRALNDLADAQFYLLFPKSQGQDFLKQKNFRDLPIGQIWHAIATDQLANLQSGKTLETIQFAPGSTVEQITGTLKPGEGRAFIAQMQAGQPAEFWVDAPDSSTQLSIYPPYGGTPLLEDSSDTRWSAQLQKDGYYEFVVVSTASEPINYQVVLTAERASVPSTNSTPFPR